MNFDLLSLICVAVALTAVCGAPPEPTKLVNGSVYRLTSQHDGKYLAEGKNGVPTKSQGSPGSSDQKFKFISAKDKSDVWKLQGISSGKSLGGVSWQVSYVGHGKYQFKNVQTGKCLQGSASEAVCGPNNPMQRWFVEPSSN